MEEELVLALATALAPDPACALSLALLSAGPWPVRLALSGPIDMP